MKAVQLNSTQTELIEKFIKQGLNSNKEDYNLLNNETEIMMLENIKPILLEMISKIDKNENISEKKF